MRVSTNKKYFITMSPIGRLGFRDSMMLTIVVVGLKKSRRAKDEWNGRLPFTALRAQQATRA